MYNFNVYWYFECWYFLAITVIKSSNKIAKNKIKPEYINIKCNSKYHWNSKLIDKHF